MSAEFICPLCGYKDIKQYPLNGDGADYRIDCARCGQYFVTDEFIQDTEKAFLKRYGYVLSGLSRELNELEQQPITFTYKEKERHLEHSLVQGVGDIDEKITKFLLNLKKRTDWFGQEVEYRPVNDYPIAYTKNVQEFRNLLKLLTEAKYIQVKYRTPLEETVDQLLLGVESMSLTVEGWRKVSALEAQNQDSEQGFIAIWFDPAGSMDSSISAIEGAIKEAGFKSMCIKGEHFSERIMDKALGEIRKSRFVVVDLSGARSSVFFEAGFAFGLNVEAIYVYKKEEEKTSSLEFYVKHYQCHPYETAEQLKDIVKHAISARIAK